MKPDSELLPLFAKMLPEVVHYFRALPHDNEPPFLFCTASSRAIVPSEYLDLCHQIENGLTDEELVRMDEILIAGFEKNERTKTYWAFTLTLPWQARVTALARVKGLI